VSQTFLKLFVDPIALRELMPLVARGADVRIYQSDKKQALHLKSYIFVKTASDQTSSEIIDGCAFIGSNNISRSALTNAHEWCFRHDFLPPKTSREAVEFEHIGSNFSIIFAHPLVKPGLKSEYLNGLTFINHDTVAHATTYYIRYYNN